MHMFNRVREFQSAINLSGTYPSLSSRQPPPLHRSPSPTALRHPLHLASLVVFTSDQTAHLVSDSRPNRRKSVVSKWAATDVNTTTAAAEAGSPRKRCRGGSVGGEGLTRAHKCRVRRSCSVDVTSRGWVRPNLTLHRPRSNSSTPQQQTGEDVTVCVCAQSD